KKKEGGAAGKGGEEPVGGKKMAAARAAGSSPMAEGSPALVMAALAEAQRMGALLGRKAAGESAALNHEIAQVQRDLSQGVGDASVNLRNMKNLKGQLVRSKQNNVQLMMDNQRNVADLMAQLAALKSPAEEQRLYQNQVAVFSGRGRAQAARAASEARQARNAELARLRAQR
ncbi:MAG: hypothetical protein HQL59_03955, partial [Magnetococcales bacterium]|nr:hypothetical protein [Magnetococcales bacterium]